MSPRSVAAAAGLAFALCLASNPDTARAGGAAVHLTFGCAIFSADGKPLRSFDGQLCAFFQDGSYAAYLSKSGILAKYAPNGALSWSRPMRLHHELKATRDGTRLLSLGSREVDGEFCRIRYDEVYAIDAKTGDITYVWSGYEHRRDLLRLAKTLVLQRIGSAREGDFGCEYTHFEGVDELSPQQSRRAFGPGKQAYLINSSGPRSFLALLTDFAHLKTIDFDELKGTRDFHFSGDDGSITLNEKLIGLGWPTVENALAPVKATEGFPASIELAGPKPGPAEWRAGSGEAPVFPSERPAAVSVQRLGGDLWVGNTLESGVTIHRIRIEPRKYLGVVFARRFGEGFAFSEQKMGMADLSLFLKRSRGGGSRP